MRFKTQRLLRFPAASVIAFAVAVVISVIAAVVRFGDSAHAIGIISADGGRARHPVVLPELRRRTTVVLTASVRPPYRGDVSVTIEGTPRPTFEVYASKPVIDLGLRRHPRFLDGTARDLRPGDRLALWLVISHRAADVEGGFARDSGAIRALPGASARQPGSPVAGTAVPLGSTPRRARDQRTANQRIVLRDLATGKVVLGIPIIFGAQEGGPHAH